MKQMSAKKVEASLILSILWDDEKFPKGSRTSIQGSERTMGIRLPLTV
ncbi:hypothetical protein [Neobacillus niacini]